MKKGKRERERRIKDNRKRGTSEDRRWKERNIK